MKHWVFAILALVIASAAALWLVESRRAAVVPAETGLLSQPSETIGGPFSLADQSGTRVTDKSWPGQYLLIYFGYTYCPDACPTELLTMGQAMDEMDKGKADRIQPIFITIDPARDDAAKLTNYVASFHPRLVGLTGTDAEVAKAADAFKVYYKKTDPAASTDYVMDHSSYVYLIDPQGKTIGVFSSDTTPDDMAHSLDSAVK